MTHCRVLLINFFAHQFFKTLTLLQRKTGLPKAIDFQEDLRILKLIIEHVIVLFAFNQRKVQHFSLVTFIPVESAHVRADLLDLHAVRDLHALDVNVVLFDECLDLIFMLIHEIGRDQGLSKESLNIEVLNSLLLKT